MSRLTCGHIQHMYSWWWVRLSPETCRVKPLRRIKMQLLLLVGLISLIYSFPVGLARSIRWICPSHLILCALMNLTISAPSIKLSISMLFPILHILSILTGPNIFLSICLSGMRRLFSSLLLKSKSPMNTWPLVLSSFYVGIILCTTNIRARSSACECFRCKYHSS